MGSWRARWSPGPQRKASTRDQRSWLGIIVVLASLRLTALARWSTAWAAAGNFRVGRQVTTRCPGLVNQALVAARAPEPSGVPAHRVPRHRIGLPSLTAERVRLFRLLLGTSEDHLGEFPLHSAPSRLVERRGSRLVSCLGIDDDSDLDLTATMTRTMKQADSFQSLLGGSGR